MDASPDLYWLLAIGLILAGGFTWELYMSVQALSWSKTTGRIIERELKRNLKDPTSVNVRIFYSYEVDGYNFVSSSIKPGVEVSSYFALPFLDKNFFADARFENGAEIEVIFDPKRPRRSAIMQGNFVSPIIGLLAGLMACAYWLYNRYYLG